MSLYITIDLPLPRSKVKSTFILLGHDIHQVPRSLHHRQSKAVICGEEKARSATETSSQSTVGGASPLGVAWSDWIL